jgi:hypothetical protein
MKITLNGPPVAVPDLFSRMPTPPDAPIEAVLHESPTEMNLRSSAIHQIESANRTAIMDFPSASSEEASQIEYQSYELKFVPLASAIKPAAKATLSMSFLF